MAVNKRNKKQVPNSKNQKSDPRSVVYFQLAAVTSTNWLSGKKFYNNPHIHTQFSI